MLFLVWTLMTTAFGPDTGKQDEALDLCIAQYRLDIANSCHDPTIEWRGAESVIDITLNSRLVGMLIDLTMTTRLHSLY